MWFICFIQDVGLMVILETQSSMNTNIGLGCGTMWYEYSGGTECWPLRHSMMGGGTMWWHYTGSGWTGGMLCTRQLSWVAV